MSRKFFAWSMLFLFLCPIPGHTDPVQLYDYDPNESYRIRCRPFFVTDIVLHPDEEITSIVAGDTVRWNIAQSYAGETSNRDMHVLVKPNKSGIETNVIIMTTERVYRLAAISSESEYDAMVRWNYPQSAVVYSKPESITTDKREQQILTKLEEGILGKQNKTDVSGLNTQGGAVPLDNSVLYQTSSLPITTNKLNFNYTVKGPDFPWTPTQVFDDQLRTYILMPLEIRGAEAPAFFVSGPRKRKELVNYRIKGRYYIIDRVFDHGILSITEHKSTQEVHIYRNLTPLWRKLIPFV